MFSHIRTSKENKEVVTELTRKFNLGSENHIARIALAYSIENDSKLDLKDLKDSGGKEYSKSVLFGEFQEIYFGFVILKYGIIESSNDLPRYLKAHLDSGLSKINEENYDISEILSKFLVS
jgi:DNA sulfur modification protein DndE